LSEMHCETERGAVYTLQSAEPTNAQCAWLREERVNYIDDGETSNLNIDGGLRYEMADRHVGKKRKASDTIDAVNPITDAESSCAMNSYRSQPLHATSSKNGKNEGPNLVLPERRAGMMADK
jgi:hypothetical protein